MGCHVTSSDVEPAATGNSAARSGGRRPGPRSGGGLVSGASLRQESDEALLELISAGDQLALGELYDRLGHVAYGLAVRVVGDRGIAEEAVQDAFLSVWGSAARFDATRGRCRSWVLTIVHRRAVDLVQRAARRPEIIVEAVPERSSPSAEETAAVLEERRVVVHALEQISDAQREAIELAYYGGYTQSQIADRLGVPLGTIKTRVYNGLRTLNALLNDVNASVSPTRFAGQQPLPQAAIAIEARDADRSSR